MPCRDDWPDTSIQQQRANTTAEHAVYFTEQLDREAPQYVQVAATQPFTNTSPDRLANYLCKLLRANEDVLQSLPEDEDSLELRLWWVQHKEKDRLRETEEAEDKRKQIILESALNKLTEEELDIMSEFFNG